MKKILSQKRKEYLKNNPDKHPWKRASKFKSIPCENFKKILREKGFSFLEEFSPSQDRLYSIDIAFPDKMIGIEVNGNQHYERDGKLKKYYQDRHNYIESLGWKLYQIHYSLCFDSNYILDLMSKILNTENKVEFNYEDHIAKKIGKVLQRVLCKCGNKKYKKAKLCKLCQCENRRITKRPSKDELHNMIWSMSALRISKIFNVSSNSIRNWCDYYKLKYPGRGYWAKFEFGKIIDYQI